MDFHQWRKMTCSWQPIQRYFHWYQILKVHYIFDDSLSLMGVYFSNLNIRHSNRCQSDWSASQTKAVFRLLGFSLKLIVIYPKKDLWSMNFHQMPCFWQFRRLLYLVLCLPLIHRFLKWFIYFLKEI